MIRAMRPILSSPTVSWARAAVAVLATGLAWTRMHWSRRWCRTVSGSPPADLYWMLNFPW